MFRNLWSDCMFRFRPYSGYNEALLKSIFTNIQNLLYPCHIQKSGLFKGSTAFRSMSDILQCLWKKVSGYNYFLLNAPSWTIFNACHNFKCADVSIRATACTPVSGVFRHIQALFNNILTYIQNLIYPWHIQNLGVFKKTRNKIESQKRVLEMARAIGDSVGYEGGVLACIS